MTSRRAAALPRAGAALAPFAVLLAFAALASCRTAGPVDLAGLTPAEIFQRAQDASDKGEFKRALAYYEGFLGQPGIDAQRAAWARYETALLYHKLGDDDTALAKVAELLALYEKDPALPAGAKILATDLQARITDKRSKK